MSNAEYMRQWRESRAQMLAEGKIKVQHGSASTYNNYRCRCRRCVRAQRERMQMYRERRRHGKEIQELIAS